MRWLQYDNYTSGHIAHIGSAPVAEDVASLVPVFPLPALAKALLASSHSRN